MCMCGSITFFFFVYVCGSDNVLFIFIFCCEEGVIGERLGTIMGCSAGCGS